MIGKTLSHFKITAKLGEGGMGEVYRAEDTQLGREVAIKVLPEMVAGDPERLARFEREAKVLASLNHPNIAAIYSIEASRPAGRGDSATATVHFLVMELVEGEDLAELIAKGPVAVGTTLAIAKQIAEGLEAAHEKSIVHRDLKPANVKVTTEGQVKVLDFGLAKALETAPNVDVDPDHLSMSPTLTAQMTQAGVLLGTAAYMSPEQASGKPVDKRADIWAFGALCLEMLSGRPIFAADSVPETLAEVIKSEIDFSDLPGDCPASIGRLLRRCLDRDPRQRLHDIADARIVIEEWLQRPREESTRHDGSASRSPSGLGSPRHALPWLLVALLAAVVGWLVWRGSPADDPGASASGSRGQVSRLVIPTLPLVIDERVPALAISPDGRRIAYAARYEGRRQIFLRQLDSLDAQPIADTDGASGPFFSPDGQRIGFAASGQLSTVSVDRGPATPLQQLGVFLGGDWGEDDTIVWGEWPTRLLWRIPAGGGTATRVTEELPDIRYYLQSAPSFVAGTPVIAFNTFHAFTAPEAPVIRVTTLDATRQATLDLAGQNVHYLPTGHLLFAREGSLLTVRFDPDTFELRGSPVAVLSGVMTNSSGAAQYDISDNGTLIFLEGGQQAPNHRMVWVERDGSATAISEERRAFWGPRLSPDGTQVATWIADESPHVWSYDLVRGGLSRVTTESANFWSLWTPDSQRLVFPSRDESGLTEIRWQLADRSKPMETLVRIEDRRGNQPLSWTPDGQQLVFQKQYHAETGFDLFLKPVDGPVSLVVGTPANEFQGMLSPDGLWLAYVSDDSGRNEVYVTPFPEAGSTIPISTQGGTEPLWSPAGSELFYRSSDHVMAVEISTDSGFQASRPRPLFEDVFIPGTPYGRNYDISRDGRRFVMIESASEVASSDRIVVVQNWFAELEELLGDE